MAVNMCGFPTFLQERTDSEKFIDVNYVISVIPFTVNTVLKA